MNVISKADFLSRDDASYEEVDVPHWGTVRVRSLSGAGRDRYIQGQRVEDKDGTLIMKTEDAEARLLALTLVDEEGNLWFDDVEEGVRILREKNAGALQKAYFAALKLNGLTEDDLEEARVNLDETPSDELGSS